MEDGIFRRAVWTPEGPGVITLRYTSHSSQDDPSSVSVDTFGEGADWLSERAADLMGCNDVIPDICALHPAVSEAQKRYGWLRIGSSHVPYHELLFAVLGQRITAADAARQWRRLVQRFGTLAPDPENRLYLPPSPADLAALPYYDLHHIGIERRRADALRVVARAATTLPGHTPPDRVMTDTTPTPSQLTKALTTLPGIGPWTAAVAGANAYGDPDALAVGDYHIKNTVAWALHGRPRGTDEEMVADLAVYAGQRHRVLRWLELKGWRAPRFGPGRRNVQIARL